MCVGKGMLVKVTEDNWKKERVLLDVRAHLPP